MVSRIIFWAGFGMATRAWQLGLQQVSPLTRKMLWGYPVFGAVGASFGYWLDGVDQKQVEILKERKEAILAKRARRAAREGQSEAA